ncbi:MAG: TlpA family protein disulfide reductase [Butyricimonas faecihominis]
MNKLFIIFLLCLPLFGWAGKDGDIKVLKKGDACPKFIFKDMDGKEVSLEQFKGKYVVIDVWLHGVNPCKQEFQFEKLEEKYKDKNIVFVAFQ